VTGVVSSNMRLAAYLADGARTPAAALPWTTCDPVEVARILQKNKVPLLSIKAQGPARAVVDDARFQELLTEERATWEGLREQYRQVKLALEAEGVADVMVKSVGLAPSFPYRSDNLDVLYHPKHEEIVRDFLCKHGYFELRNVEEPLKYLFRKFHLGESVSAIHAHIHVGWMVSFLDEEAVRQGSSPAADDPLVNVPGADDALLTTLAHYFYEDKRIVLLDVIKFAHCLRRGVDWERVYHVASWRGWRDGLNVALLFLAYQESVLYGETLVPGDVLQQAVAELPGWTRRFLESYLRLPSLATYFAEPRNKPESARQEAPLPIPFVFSKIFFYTKLLRDPTRSPRTRLKDLVVHTSFGTKLRLRIHSQPRMLITFSGVDGSGKTTQAQMLRNAFETCLIRADHVWSRGGSSTWLTPLLKAGKRLISGRAGAARIASVQPDKVSLRKEKFKSAWVRGAWSWVLVLELLWQYFWHVGLRLGRGRVVICDRYVCDLAADLSAYFDQHADEASMAVRLLRQLVPRPQFAYWLDVVPATANTRSPDILPVPFVQAQSDAYSRMAEHGLLTRVDGGQGPDMISDRIVYDVLTRYFGQYHTFVNTLFHKNPGQWR